ncbi:hypothetical protein J1N35_040473 [Gossypium stocksii]|uniref:RNase H type-1 domain-containing protein n=1 Tax=Gossypium stocksii TaxID=47602 RepID=A0A9D3UDR8_9ROSI|nr:hypothetical protein J1N35_040473 [Gossypium stocksii]
MLQELWKSDLPSKINITVWRATLNYLPTLVNLRTKRLVTEAICQRCKQGLETREHVFCDCAVTKETWKQLEFSWPQSIRQSEFMEWFTWILLNNTTEGGRIFICAIWAIWSARNSWMHEEQRRSGTETANFILRYMQELKDTKNKDLALNQEPELWRPPKQGFFKINFDAAFDSIRHKSCSGIIIRNFRGEIIASKTTVHTNIFSSFAAEANACLQAVREGRNMGLNHVIIEGDSLTVIKKAQSPERDRSEIGTFIFDIKAQAADFYECQFQQV